MNVAKCQNHIRRTYRGNRGFGRRLQHRNDHLTVNRWISLELLFKGLGACSPSYRFVKFSAVFEQWRQNFGIPAIARPYLDHGHVRLNPEKGGCLERMAILVASL